MKKISTIVIGTLILGFLILCGYAYDQNQKYDQWISSLDRSKYINKDERNGNIGDNFEGNKDAKVLIIEYADFQCPACATTFPFLSSVVKEYEGKVGLIYRNYVLTYHKNGTASAYASNAAAIQGYWHPFVLKLFKNQAEWEDLNPEKRDAKFRQYFEEASDHKGDSNKFIADMNSEAVKKKVKADMAIAKHVNIEATPTILVNNQRIDITSVKESDFKKIVREKIETALKEAEKTK